MIDLVSSAGCNGLCFSPISPLQKGADSLMLSGEEEMLVRDSFFRAKRRLKALSIKHNIDWALMRYEMPGPLWQAYPCYTAWFHTRIMTDGLVKSCGLCDKDLAFGDLQKQTFREIWNGPAIRSFRKKMLTRKGFESLSEHCDCSTCCFFWDIVHIHRYFKWFSPLVELRKNALISYNKYVRRK